nr:protein kinase, ATP binding site-containing protein [Tanacetum cinerariifolium]
MLVVREVLTACQLSSIQGRNQETVSTKLSGECRNPRKTIIPLKEIKLATRNFSEESRIGYRIEGATYIGQLSDRWQNRMAMIQTYNLEHEDFPKYDGRQSKFLQELDIISRIHHDNIIPYIGHCNEDNEMIIVYEHAINGSLRDHLQDPDKLRCLEWEQRLKICLGAARGLKYLHSGFWEENRVVHRYVRSQFILLDENMEAKISEFALSKLVSRSKPQTSSDWKTGSPEYDCKDYEKYMDPIYKESYIVNTEIDVYSFGVVMFEILSGLMASERTSFKDDDANANDNDKEERNLIKWVHRYYGDDELDKLLDPNIKDQIHGRSLHIIAETAYKCLSYNVKERPSMNRIIKRIEEALYIQNHGATELTTTIQSHKYKKLNDLLTSLKEIDMATSNFSENFRIGNGGFGVVYKGQLSKQWPDHEVAIKRLNKTGHHVKTEFLNELNMISRFHHQNIIRFIGYCNEGDEMIFVYEYAVNGSLESHLENLNKIRCLTWMKRLKICLGAAKGLDYLHSGLGEDNRVIHRDVKSGNILLDDNLEAKICDFGFSKSDSTKNLQQSQLYTKVAGTNYYTDPIYHESGILRTESDVYSFGVVMFEMLSGMLAWYRRKIGDGKPQPLINLVRQYYDYGKELLIDPQIKDQIDNSSFQTFIDIAYQCISFNSKKRPTMEMVIDKIEEALDFQVKMEVSS